jgi:hypothetical protein
MAAGVAGVSVKVTGWTGARVTVEPTGHAAETWSYDSEIGTDGLSWLAFGDAFYGWLVDAARGWYGSVDFDPPTLTTPGPRMNAIIGARVLTSWTVNAAAAAMTGFATNTSTKTWTGSAGGAGTVASLPEFGGWAKFVTGSGPSSGEGGWHGEHPVYAPHRPVLTLLLTVAEAAAWSEALKIAYSPREMSVWHEASSTFRLVRVAKTLSMEPVGVSHYRLAVEVLG